MLQFPLGDILIVVLEPGNVNRMRAGKPLHLNIPAGCKRVGMIVTPDLEEFTYRLKLPCTPEEFEKIVEQCKSLPEVIR